MQHVSTKKSSVYKLQIQIIKKFFVIEKAKSLTQNKVYIRPCSE